MAGLTDRGTIFLLEAADRRARITTTGMEITTTFYVEPATAAPEVVSRLLGSVTGNDTNGERTLPAHDHEYPFCYCVEAHESPVDRRAVASSPAMLWRTFGGGASNLGDIDTALAKPIIFNGPQSLNSNGTHETGAVPPNLCGAFIEAVYRPLSTIYKPATGADASKAPEQFDYLDPQFYPCSRSFPTGKRLLADYTGAILEQPIGESGLRTETWQEFTIRRVMCPCVPWDTIRQLTNRINGDKDWTPANMTIARLPNNTFTKGTLRFDSAEPVKRVVPSCLDSTSALIFSDSLVSTQALQWYDILYKFSWRTTFAIWYDTRGIVQPIGEVPWWCEWWDGGKTATHAAPSSNMMPGWYEAVYPDDNSEQDIDNYHANHKYLHAEYTELPINKNGLVAGATHPFDQLFLLKAP